MLLQVVKALPDIELVTYINKNIDSIEILKEAASFAKNQRNLEKEINFGIANAFESVYADLASKLFLSILNKTLSETSQLKDETRKLKR